MRTKRIIMRVMQDDQLYGTYCNDPDYELGSDAKVDETITVKIEDFGQCQEHESFELNPGECGQCGSYHLPGFVGDCREDDQRFYPVD